ncbi:hypothetical protein CVT26_006453 [Gymnopilus dilepis]|uniref:Uncharacterized protein n=1 Tax=Gymnopilus dilepis TaxID=231916 RepID=A0A409Y1R5_9AGAR|nr:hypothetical protein CVT26_006453 [Gymnopilus dilepis]
MPALLPSLQVTTGGNLADAMDLDAVTQPAGSVSHLDDVPVAARAPDVPAGVEPLLPDPPSTPPSVDPPPSNARSLQGQTTGSFISAGGSSVRKTTKGKKKSAQEEIGPEDSEPVIAIGCTPFIPAQDAMFNQNRLVGNEAIMAMLIQRLLRESAKSEQVNVQRYKDIADMVADHTKSIANLSSTINSMAVATPRADFVNLFDAHIQTRNALNQLASDVSTLSASTQASITAIQSAQDDDSNLSQLPIPPLFQSSGTAHAPPPSPQGASGVKRKRGPLSHSTVSVRGGRGAHSAAPRPPFSANDTSGDVAYGPVNVTASEVRALADAAVKRVGLAEDMVRSVRLITGFHGNATFASIRFKKPEYATKFVTLVGYGLDGCPERVAFLADKRDAADNAGSIASSSKMQMW